MPLFLFHLLEYLPVELDLDLDDINQRWQELAAVDLWSQMIIKETSPGIERIERRPDRGVLPRRSGALVFQRAALDWHQLQSESEAFFLRIYGAGDYRWKGADLGVLVTKGRLQIGAPGKPATLTIRARHLIRSLRALYAGTPVTPPPVVDHLRTGWPRESAGQLTWRWVKKRAVPRCLNLDNWQVAPQLRWSFQHIEDLFPTAVISRGTGPVVELPRRLVSVGDLRSHSRTGPS